MPDQLFKKIHLEDRKDLQLVLDHTIKTGETFSKEFRIDQGENEVVAFVKGQMKNYDPDTHIMYGSTMDITNIVNTRAQLQQKDEFINIAGHELKTPLTSVKAYLQLLKRSLHENKNKESIDYTNKASSQLDKVNGLVQDLLEMARIQGSKLVLKKTEIDLSIFLDELIEDFSISFPGYHFIKICTEDIELTADKKRLEQIMVNLISNAVKYSPENKEIIIATKLIEGNAMISIIDKGIGVPKEKLPMIFDRFFRVENTSAKFSGLGIGLYISAELIKAHHGKIWVESEEGEGSKFTFTISLK